MPQKWECKVKSFTTDGFSARVQFTNERTEGPTLKRRRSSAGGTGGLNKLLGRTKQVEEKAVVQWRVPR